MQNVKEIVAKNIVSLRQKSGLTQLELAEKLNYSDKAVSKWEHGDSMPDVAVLIEIANILNVTLDDLVSQEDTDKGPKFKDYVAPLKYNRGIITAASVVLVWLVAVVGFVLASLLIKNSENSWLGFIYAVPVSAIVWIVLNSIWFNKRRNYLIASILLWSVLASVQVTLIVCSIDVSIIYLVGIPAQAIILLFSFFKKIKK